MALLLTLSIVLALLYTSAIYFMTQYMTVKLPVTV